MRFSAKVCQLVLDVCVRTQQLNNKNTNTHNNNIITTDSALSLRATITLKCLAAQWTVHDQRGREPVASGSQWGDGARGGGGESSVVAYRRRRRRRTPSLLSPIYLTSTRCLFMIAAWIIIPGQWRAPRRRTTARRLTRRTRFKFSFPSLCLQKHQHWRYD